jgi:hypothetical protein
MPVGASYSNMADASLNLVFPAEKKNKLNKWNYMNLSRVNQCGLRLNLYLSSEITVTIERKKVVFWGIKPGRNKISFHTFI